MHTLSSDAYHVPLCFEVYILRDLVLSEGLLGVTNAGELHKGIDVAPLVDDLHVDDLPVSAEHTIEVF